MKSVYLAGPITGLSYGVATDWRDVVSDTLLQNSIKPLSPMRGKFFLSKEERIGQSYKEVMGSAAWINTRDFNDVRTSDALLVNFLDAKIVSIGTVLEIGAAKAQNKPIVIVMEEGNIHEHVMLSFGHVVVPTLEEGANLIIQLLS